MVGVRAISGDDRFLEKFGRKWHCYWCFLSALYRVHFFLFLYICQYRVALVPEDIGHARHRNVDIGGHWCLGIFENAKS